ncbi:MarR family transcriptional regulator [Sphingomonas sinipercae]|uniref:MarR family transcriptional regulator n=1 Tax=Sphingomonas sinipercae TaxID=2714944 RepID=A0A6G7ZPV1_9SPHN|nr:MarR family transcriptional regulator [Sphingomonas sinipercae]QIL03017.1 MarR family transcriptional regulator [Sphingomonas sinipercae]
MQQVFLNPHSPAALASRFARAAQRWLPDGPAERADTARRKLLNAIVEREPATLNEVADALGRGAPAVSRSVDTMVRAGLVERQPDPDHRRRLALRLTDSGRDKLAEGGDPSGALTEKLARLAQSELRAVERAIEILERGL